jgi:hypothetical protein
MAITTSNSISVKADRFREIFKEFIVIPPRNLETINNWSS